MNNSIELNNQIKKALANKDIDLANILIDFIEDYNSKNTVEVKPVLINELYDFNNNHYKA